MAKPIKRKKKSSKNTSMDSNMSMDSYSSSIDRDVELEHGTLEALKTQFKNAQNNNETSDPETLLRHNKELQTKNLELIKKLNKTTVERDNFEKLFLDWKKINKDASNALEYLQNEQMLLKKQNIKLTELNENMELKILKLSTELIDKNEMVEHLVHKTNKLNKQLNNFSDINNNLRKIVNENNKKNNKNKLLIENNKLKFEIENKNLILNNILSQFSTFYSVIKNHYPNYNFGQNNTLLKQAKSNPYGNGATKIDRKGKKKRKSWKLEDNKLIRDKILNGKFDDNIVDDIYNRSNSSDDDVALFKNGKTNTTVDDELRLMNAASDTSHKVQFVNIEAETKKNDDLSYNLGSFSMNGGPRQRSQSDGMFLRSSNKKSQSAHSIFKTKYEYKRTQLLFDQKIWSKRDSLKRKKKFQISAIPSSSNPNTPHVSVRGNNSDDDNIIQNNNNELNIKIIITTKIAIYYIIPCFVFFFYFFKPLYSRYFHF
mmetsp:Transcript_40391/g.49820  ORF Transcript_40391/g.49820 Transcript_40391/m.49820 type:complete len:486 (-) Transcript_40391:44-1501(-)